MVILNSYVSEYQRVDPWILGHDGDIMEIQPAWVILSHLSHKPSAWTELEIWSPCCNGTGPGNGKIFHRNINSLIFLDFPLPCCTDATIGWHHTSSIYIPNQQDTSPTIAWYYIPCWVATYVVCWLVDSEYSCWSEVTVGKPNLWLCLLLKVAILEHINT